MTMYARNWLLLAMFLLTWIYLYVPNPYLSLLSVTEQSEPASNDLLFLWLPVLLGAVAYAAHAGRWFVRLGLAILPPLLLLGAVFALGVAGLMSKEGAGWTLIALVLPLRGFVVALAVTTIAVEVFKRVQSGNPNGTSVT